MVGITCATGVRVSEGMNSYRKNGNYLVVYGVVLPDTLKHLDDAGQPVDGFVLTVQQAPFCDATIDSAKETIGVVYQYPDRLVLWANVVSVATGEVVFSQRLESVNV